MAHSRKCLTSDAYGFLARVRYPRSAEYYRASAAALVVFDVTRRDTFRNVRKWVEEIKAEGNSNVILVLIANKIDLTT